MLLGQILVTTVQTHVAFFLSCSSRQNRLKVGSTVSPPLNSIIIDSFTQSYQRGQECLPEDGTPRMKGVLAYITSGHVTLFMQWNLEVRGKMK